MALQLGSVVAFSRVIYLTPLHAAQTFFPSLSLLLLPSIGLTEYLEFSYGLLIFFIAIL